MKLHLYHLHLHLKRIKTEIKNRKNSITKVTNTRVKKIEDARRLLLDNAYDEILNEKNQQLTLIQNKLTTLDNRIGGYENEKQQIFQNEKMAIETSKQAQISSKKEEFAKKRALQEIENKRLDDERQKKFNSEFGISVIGYEETPEQRLLDEKLKKARAKDIYDTMYERNKDFINSATTDELESKLKENDILIDVYKEELSNPMNYFMLKEKNGLLIEELSAVNQIINEKLIQNEEDERQRLILERRQLKKRPSIDETQPDIKSRRVDLEQRLMDETSLITGINNYKAFIANNNLFVDVDDKQLTKEYFKTHKRDMLERLREGVKNKIKANGPDITFNKDLTQKK